MQLATAASQWPCCATLAVSAVGSVTPQPPCFTALPVQQLSASTATGAAGCKPRQLRCQRQRQVEARWGTSSQPQRHRLRPVATLLMAGAEAEQAPERSRPWSHEGLDAGHDEECALASYMQLQSPQGGADIHLFGVIHGSNESKVAEFIMRQHPELVVVETSLNTAHGSAHRNTIRRQDCLTFTHGAAPGSHEQRARLFAQYGVQLADMAHPLGSHLWHDLSQGCHALYNEQLVYVAAFAVGADLVFGDRPKQITYSRMLWLPSIVDLDQAYGAMSSGNYEDLVRQAASHQRALGSANATEAALLGERDAVMLSALLGERDAVMLSALHNASLQCGPGGSVVGVVGASHLAGMQRLWDSGSWRGLMAQGLLEAPTGPRTPETAEDTGVRRALLDGVIRLSCRTDVQQDVRRVLGPVPPESHEAYSLAHELYGTTRMLLAVLDRPQLEEVCQGWRCNMWDVLAPVRAVRPLNGGPGYDRDLVLDLRTLNFEIA